MISNWTNQLSINSYRLSCQIFNTLFGKENWDFLKWLSSLNDPEIHSYFAKLISPLANHKLAPGTNKCRRQRDATFRCRSGPWYLTFSLTVCQVPRSAFRCLNPAGLWLMSLRVSQFRADLHLPKLVKFWFIME